MSDKMKKLFFAAGIVCLLAACETKYYSVLITNESSKTVSYTYNDVSDTLPPYNPSQDPSEYSKTYEVEAYTMPPKNIKDENGIASIEMNRDGDNFIFKDATPIGMNIRNALPDEVKRIKAGNYISYNGSFLVSVPGGETISDELYIYTNKPDFSLEADNGIIEPSYSVTFKWTINKNKMFVTIK